MSKVIKSFHYSVVDDVKMLEKKQILHDEIMIDSNFGQEDSEDSANGPISQEIQKEKEQILEEAEALAEEIVRNATLESQTLKETTLAEIDAWWSQKRELDEQVVSDAQVKGYEEGYQLGLLQAEEHVREESKRMLDEIKEMLEQAYMMKEQIVQEAEPFLIELSCSIAEKIITKQLTISQEWIVDLIKQTLIRKKEKGTVTLCVSPSSYQYVLNNRDELALVIDSQAELNIVPDSSVQDYGCVVRSSLGSIDARIDTQLIEIKKALQMIAHGNEE